MFINIFSFVAPVNGENAKQIFTEFRKYSVPGRFQTQTFLKVIYKSLCCEVITLCQNDVQTQSRRLKTNNNINVIFG